MKFDIFCARVFSLVVVVLVSLMAISVTAIGCGGGGGTPVEPAPTWQSPIGRYNVEVHPLQYIEEETYQLRLMKNAGDVVDVEPNEVLIGLYRADDLGVLYSQVADLRFVPTASLFINELGEFRSEEPGIQMLTVEVRDSAENVYITVELSLAFLGTPPESQWESPIGRYEIEAQPAQYRVGQFYQIRLVESMGDIIDRQSDEVMVGLYRADDEGALFSNVLGLRFVPYGANLFITEFGRFSADSEGQHTVVTQIRDTDGHLYTTVTLHPYFVLSGDIPPPPSCRDLHPIPEAHEGEWWDCVNGEWVNTGELVNPPPPPNNDLDPIPSDGNVTAYYGGMGLQSISLGVESPGGLGDIGFIVWEIWAGSSGAMTVPIGANPSVECEFCYESSGTYTVWASPYESEDDYQNLAPPIGGKAIFTITVIDG